MPRPVKVLYVLGSLAGGGAERTAVNLIHHIDENRVALRLGLISAKGDYLDQVQADYIITPSAGSLTDRLLTLCPRRGFGLIRTARLIRSMIGFHRPDLVVTSVQPINLAAWLAIRMPPSLHTKWLVREGNNTMATLTGNAKRYWLKWAYGSADGVLAICEGVKKGLVRKVGMSADRIHVIYNPVDLDQIRAASVEPIKWPLSAPFILAAGRLHPQKGFDVLIRAYAKIHLRIERELIILGEGPLRAELQALARELGIADRVHFPGFQRNPWAWMAKADLFVLSSRYEGFGHVIVEAMACGTPVVSTDCDFGPSEILDGGSCGVLTPVGQPDALADSIVNTLTSPTRMSELRIASMRRARDFDVTTIARRYQDHFFDITSYQCRQT
jgi:glycosyltransferase involved in cell wall biosynthesis